MQFVTTYYGLSVETYLRKTLKEIPFIYDENLRSHDTLNFMNCQ